MDARAGLLRRLRQRPLGLAGLGILGLLVLVSLLADVLAADLPIAARVQGELYLLPCVTRPVALRGEDIQSLRRRLEPQRGDWMLAPPVPFGPYRTELGTEPVPGPPGPRHWLGTDEVGRDVLARLIHGTRVSLGVGFGAVALSVLLGLLLGSVAAWFGGAIDAVVSRTIEVVLSFPTVLLVLVTMALIERPAIWQLVLVIALTRWPEVARLVRAEVLRLRGLEFVEAARALGAGDLRILARHLIPNALAPVLVAATFGIGSAVLLEGALSFLGFGAPPPSASWGELLTQAHRYLVSPGAWWLAVFPGGALFVTVLACNLIGEALRDALDPRLRR